MKLKKGNIVFFAFLVVAILAIVGTTTVSVWNNVNKGLDLKGGFEVLYEAEEKVDTTVLKDTAHALSKRIDSLGVREPSITVESPNRIRVQLAGVKDQDHAREILKKQAMLTFRDPSGQEVLLSGKDLKAGGAKVNYNDQNKPVVVLQVKDASKLASVTQRFKGQKMPIYLDDNMLSDPIINDVITDGSAIITGQRSITETKDLVDLLNAGAVPVKLKEIQSFAVDASLGEDSMYDTLLAAFYGVVAIIIFIIGYYRLPGFVAIISLIAYAYLVLLAFMLLDVTLTLPGIAAFVLGIGMAVDANVIMYERVREELRRGKSIAASVRFGSRRSFLTIFDAHITTLIAAGVLLIYGTAGVKGFAVSLITGILVSFITAVALARFMMTLLVKSNLLKRVSWFTVRKDEICDL